MPIGTRRTSDGQRISGPTQSSRTGFACRRKSVRTVASYYCHWRCQDGLARVRFCLRERFGPARAQPVRKTRKGEREGMPSSGAARPQVIRHYERRSHGSAGARTCIDLFSGAGGLAEGFLQAGFSVLSGTDLDGAAGATFRHNFPGASFFECPISDLTGAELLADAGLRPGELDCLLGGVPCQSFSYNNHERSRRGARARLFRDYLRIVEALEPRCLVMENVPGILTVGGGAVIEEIYEALGELGYECDGRILYSEDYGVPQARRRVFFVATRLGWEDALFPRGCAGPVAKPSASANPYVHRWARETGEPY